MTLFRRLDIRNKLALVLWGAAFLALLLGLGALMLFNHLTIEERARRAMEPYAQLVSVGAVAAVAFEDPVRAQEILDTLRANSQIVEAAIRLEDGRVLASYSRTSPPGPRPPWPKGTHIAIARGRALLVQDLHHGGQLALTMRLDHINRQIRAVYWTAAIAMFVLLAITFGQVAVLQRTIIRPIAALAQAAERVRADRDYRFALDATGTDEVARLAHGFEAMLIALREREDDLRSLTLFQRAILDNAAYGIVSTTPPGIVSSVNPAAERLLGYSRQELVAHETPLLWHDLEEIQRRAHQLSGELGEPVPCDFNVFTALAQRGRRDESEWTLVRKDGARVPILLSMTALRDQHGDVSGFLGLINELTERKRAEEALRASQALHRSFVEQLPNGVFRLDREGRYVMVNAQLCRSKGLRPDEFVGRTPVEVARGQHEEGGEDEAFIKHAEQSEATHDLIMRTGKVVEKEEDYSDREGRRRCVDVIRMPVYDATGEVIGSQGIEFDITERKEMESQHLRAQRMEVIGTLASGIAHDLNNILLPILLASELLRAKLASAEDLEDVAMIEDSAWRGASIIRQLLLFGRGAEGPRTRTDLASLMKEVTKIMRETFPRNIEIVEASARDLWSVQADGTQMHQVLMNLCVNARDAMPNGGTLTVGAKNVVIATEAAAVDPQAKAGRYVEMTVADSGHGIDAESLSRIFDPFYTTKALGKGSGLGLSTVLAIVKKHDGVVRVDTELEKGSVFRVFIPAAEEERPVLSQSSSLPSSKGNGELVLVVDDEQAICSVLRRALERQNYRVLTASNGQEALELFQEHRADVRLVITDLMMPIMDGVALIRSVRALDPKLPIIAASGLDVDANPAHLSDLGVEELLAKPLGMRPLLEAMHRLLSS